MNFDAPALDARQRGEANCKKLYRVESTADMLMRLDPIDGKAI
jgi:hypothetical protein